MKRYGNLYSQICSIPNLELADERARVGKRHQYGVIRHDRNRDGNIHHLHDLLTSKTYHTSNYTISTIYDPKERTVYKLPYFPDRITHHAVMNVMKPIFVSTFTRDTYSCIEGRGTHSAVSAVWKSLQDVEGTKYCLKLDIRKFYPSIDHQILKSLLWRKIKDYDLMWLMGDIIDSAPGVPIGNYLSQPFANFYLTYLDHYIKEQLRVKYYFRYADDIVIPASNKPYLHDLLGRIREYLYKNLKLEIKKNYQVFPVAARSIDFCGYNIYHSHIRLRKRTKKRFARSVARKRYRAALASYTGLLSHCNGKNLLKTIFHEHNIHYTTTRSKGVQFVRDQSRSQELHWS